MAPTIHLHKLIVHKVDHKSYDEPQLSDLESPISEDVASFVRQHITTNREHRFTRSAVFISRGNGEVDDDQEGNQRPNPDEPIANEPIDAPVGDDEANVDQDDTQDVGNVEVNTDEQPAVPFDLEATCRDLLSNDRHFVEASKSIARHLFQSMDQRVSPGDLVVCTFSEENPESPKWLALLKMDPQDGFIGDREERDGQVRIVLRRVADVMPSGELQKCAFVAPQETRAALGYDLRVLDQQSARYGASRMVASFFITTFLQCNINLNRADKTQVFVYGSNEWIASKEDSWSGEDIDRFVERVRVAVQDNEVSVTEFAPAVISQPTEQEEYYEYLRDKGLHDLTFQPDPNERRRLLDYVVFEGDEGLQIRIKRDAIGEGRTMAYRRDEGTNEVIVTISTTHWQEKIKRGR